MKIKTIADPQVAEIKAPDTDQINLLANVYL